MSEHSDSAPADKKVKYEEEWFKGESDFAQAAYLLWRDLPRPRTLDNLLAIIATATHYDPPTMGTAKKWKCVYKWDDRTDAYDEFCGRNKNEVELIDPINDPLYVLAVQKHQADFRRMTSDGSTNLQAVFSEYGKLLETGAKRLKLPEELSITQFQKMVNTYASLVKSAQDLHALSLKAEGVEDLIEDLDLMDMGGGM